MAKSNLRIVIDLMVAIVMSLMVMVASSGVAGAQEAGTTIYLPFVSHTDAPVPPAPAEPVYELDVVVNITYTLCDEHFEDPIIDPGATLTVFDSFGTFVSTEADSIFTVYHDGEHYVATGRLAWDFPYHSGEWAMHMLISNYFTEDDMQEWKSVQVWRPFNGNGLASDMDKSEVIENRNVLVMKDIKVINPTHCYGLVSG